MTEDEGPERVIPAFRTKKGTLSLTGVRLVSKLSMRFGVIPLRCPVCGRQFSWLTWRFHKWGHKADVTAVAYGCYRRICWYCRRALIRHYGMQLPDWPEQYVYLKGELGLPEDTEEGWWSVVTPYEEGEVLRLLAVEKSILKQMEGNPYEIQGKRPEQLG